MAKKRNQRSIDAGRAESVITPVDEEVQREFVEAQRLGSRGDLLIKRLSEHHSQTPALSGGDLDATWDRAGEGEETVGGSNPTPDQNVVEDLGTAMGVHYEDNEPLHTTEKLQDRDRKRWDFDPASAEDYRERARYKRK